MKFNKDVIQLKERYLDSVPYEFVLKSAKHFLGKEQIQITPVNRPWNPGGGSQLFIANSESNSCFIKAKHKSILVESALESENEFISVSSLENERNFLNKLSYSHHIPKLLGFQEYDDYLFLAVEVLSPFSTIHRLNPVQIIKSFELLYSFVRELYDMNIIHTDIHEKNVCFREDLTPVIIDFEEARYKKQNVPFECSLDVKGQCEGDDVGNFPIFNNSDIPGFTCMNRLKKVFNSIIKDKLPEYIAKCNFDNSSSFNLDTEQQPDERIYQSINLPDFTIQGQRPINDKRYEQVNDILLYAHSILGRPLHVVDLGSNMGMFSFFCADNAQTASIVGLEGDPRYVEAAKILSFYNDSDKVIFVEYATGIVPYSWKTDVLLMLSVYHHVSDKDAFLQELGASNITCILGEFATQERYYPQRGNVYAEIEYIKKVLNFKHAQQISITSDYQRPMIAFHNGQSESIYSFNKVVATTTEKALNWLKNNTHQTGGILIHSKAHESYPEVTGYIIPTLIDYGMKDFALELGQWLLTKQQPNGGFLGAGSNKVFLFDVGQVLRGLLALSDTSKLIRTGAERVMHCLYNGMLDGGKTGFIRQYDNYGNGIIPEGIMLYTLPPFIEAARKFEFPQYIEAAEKCIDFYMAGERFLDKKTLLHFLSYEIEAMIDLGRCSDVLDILSFFANNQNIDGTVRAYESVEWVCIPGLSQLAVCWYKAGMSAPADKAMEWLDANQSLSGGFLGSVGNGANYFPKNEPSWAVKYYLDAQRWRIRRHFDQNVDIFPTEISVSDGRFIAVANEINNNQIVVDAGCGRGRFLKKLLEKYPNSYYTGVDLSEKMLENLSNKIKGVQGTLENIPLPDNYADVVFSVEAIEHSVNISGAISEIARICKPGGKIVIIDKQESEWGRFVCPPWERWPERNMLEAIMSQYCISVKSMVVEYGHPANNDQLMVKWVGIKEKEFTRRFHNA
ncbi:MAG: methyltransferase domain-containing protein [Chitinispirillales bacterium]|nr:methyltransferase domain-containing protein [Chitinispirillales bacterium]